MATMNPPIQSDGDSHPRVLQHPGAKSAGDKKRDLDQKATAHLKGWSVMFGICVLAVVCLRDAGMGAKQTVQASLTRQLHGEEHLVVNGGGRVDPVDLAVAAMLLGTVAFNMSIFYLVNNKDEDIKRHSWAVISSTIAIFVAVLVFQGMQGVISGLVTQYVMPFAPRAAGQLFLVVTKYLEVFTWFCVMHAFIHAQASGILENDDMARTMSLVEAESDKEQKLKCWSTLFAHMSGFAAISGGCSMQHMDYFAQAWYYSLIPMVITGIFEFFLFRGSDYFRSIVEARAGKDDLTCQLWGEYAEEAENEIGGLSISFLIVQTVVFYVTGHLPPAHGEEHHEAPEVEPVMFTVWIVGFALVFMTCTVTLVFMSTQIATAKNKRGSCVQGSQAGFDTMEDYLKRWYFISQTTVAMCIAWSFLFAFEWEVHRLLTHLVPGGGVMLNPHSTVQHVFLALAVSFLSFAFIFALDYLQDLPVTGDVVDSAIRKIIKAIAILIGFSWEEAFDTGVEEIASLTGSRWSLIGTKLALGLGVGMVVVPAWRWYILKKVIELEKVYDEDEDKETRRTQVAGGPRKEEDEVTQEDQEEPLLQETQEDAADPYADAGCFERDIGECASMQEQPSNGLLYNFKTGNTFCGEWDGCKRHGYGTQVWKDRSRYQGQWKNNSANGLGKLTYPNGDYYIGQFADGKANGFGTYYSKDDTYMGQFTDDVQDGFGMELRSGGSRYEGEMTNGVKQGHGVYNWADGSSALGKWENNLLQGPGMHVGLDQRCFKGEWKDNSMHGCGLYTYPDGKRYSGCYSCDNKHGFGMFYWPDGSKYEGFWADGKQAGDGRFTRTDGSTKQGTWTAGTLTEPKQ